MKSTILFLGIFVAIALSLVAIFAVFSTSDSGFVSFLRRDAPTVQYDIDEKQNLSIAGIKSLQVEAKSADIKIESMEVEDSLGAELSLNLSGQSHLEKPLSFQRIGDRLQVNVESDQHEGITFRGKLGNGLKLVVKLPKIFTENLRLESGSGEIDLRDLAIKNVELVTGSGEVGVARADFDHLEMTVGSGDVSVSGSIRNLRVETGSGEIDVTELKSERAWLQSGSGEIEIRGVTAQRIEAQTGSGDVVARLGNLSLWSARARTGSGEIRSGFSGSEKIEGREEVKFGSGAQEIDVKTGSGNVSIVQ